MGKPSRVPGFLGASVLCLAYCAVAFSQLETARVDSNASCDKDVQSALIRAVRQQRVDPQKLESCGNDIRTPAEGDHSIPVMAAAARVLSGHQDAEDFLPYLKGKGGWSLADEPWSSIYGPQHLVSALALRDRTGNAKTDRSVRKYLRANWMLLTLSAASSPPRLVSYYRGDWLDRRLNLRDYQGLFVNIAGPRSAVDRALWVERSTFHGLLSAALDWPWTPRRPLPRARAQGPDWPLALAAELAEGKLQGTKAELWGLTRAERAALRSYLDRPTATAARRLVRWVKPFDAPTGVNVTWIRYRGRGVATVMSRSRDGQDEGPWLVAAATPDRAWRIQSRRAGIRGDRILAWDRRQEDGVELPTKDFGQELFRIVWDRRGWRVKSP